MTHPEETDLELDVAIVGMAARFGGAPDLESFWRLLMAGEEAVRDISPEEYIAAGGRPSDLDDPDLVLRRAAIDGIEEFDAEYFGIGPAEAVNLDPQHRLFLEAAHRALEHAGQNIDDAERAVGVYAGAGAPGYLLRNVLPWRYGEAGTDAYAETMSVAMAAAPSTLATRVAYLLGLTGPAVAVASACSTSLVAVHLACQDLIGMRADVAVAGGATANPASALGYRWIDGGLMSKEGRCRPFDAEADGIIGSDGVAAVVLKRLEDAVADGNTIYAVIAGSALNNDGRRKVGFAAPSVRGQAEVIAAAQAAAGVGPADISYVEAHGTATRVGDPIEVAALTQAFADAGPGAGSGAGSGDGSGDGADPAAGTCWLGSVKANIGHTDTAAGAAGLIKAALALHHGRIPATVNHTAPNPLIDFAAGPFRVVTANQDWPRTDRPRYAGVSSFGIGGTNAHVVLREAPEPASSNAPEPAVPASSNAPEPTPPLPGGSPSASFAGRTDSFGGPGASDRPVVHNSDPPGGCPQATGADEPQLLVLSARSAPALADSCAALAAHLRDTEGQDLADVARTLHHGRPALAFRTSVVVPGRFDLEAAARLLDARAAELHRSPVGPSRSARSVVFAFGGGGAVSASAVAALERFSPAFARSLRESGQALRPLLQVDLADLLRTGRIPDGRDDPDGLSPAAVVALEFALTDLLATLGVAPTTVLGHSLGEYVAASVAGVMRRDQLLRVAALRQRALDRAGGASEAVLVAPEELGPLPAGLTVGVVTSPESCVVSGDAAVLDDWLSEPRFESIPHLRLPFACAAHSPLLEAARDELRALLSEMTLAPPDTTWVSTLTGAAADTTRARDVEAWVRHTIEPVDFPPAVRAAFGRARPALIEIGPGRAVTRGIRELLGERTVATALLPGRDEDPVTALLAALGTLWSVGVDLDLAPLRPAGTRLVPLPGHPWRRRRYWVDPPAAAGRPSQHRPGPDTPPLSDERRDSTAPTGPAPGHRQPRPALSTPYVEPDSELGARVCALCATSLGFDRVGLDDDVFTLGADSLAALRLVQRIRAEFGTAPGLREFLDNPRIRTLTSHVERNEVSR